MASQEGFPTPLEIKVLAEGKFDKVLLLLGSFVAWQIRLPTRRSLFFTLAVPYIISRELTHISFLDYHFFPPPPPHSHIDMQIIISQQRLWLRGASPRGIIHALLS
jgi:hypothetical protein